MNKIKKILGCIVAVAVVVVCAVSLLGNDLEHIEDTNGEDNYALQEITDDNIINLDIGTKGGYKEETDSLSNTTEYSAEKFTGVAEIYGENITTNSLTFTVNHAKVTSGNFRLLLLVDDKIVHDFTLNELTQTFVLKNVSGFVSLRIAGESANFQFDYYIQ